jgi:hypothetical protein
MGNYFTDIASCQVSFCFVSVDTRTLSIQADNSDYSSRVHALVEALRAERSRYMQLHFIKEGDGYAEAYFARFLVEDR